MDTEKISKMEDGKEKKLMEMLSEGGKPFVRKADGYAKKVEEDKEITWKDYNEQELTLKVPAGSYIVTDVDSCYPKIVTAEDFEKKNKFIDGPKKKEDKKEDNSPKIGLDTQDY